MQVDSRYLQPKGSKPGPIIVKAAKKEKANLIVLGTRGMNALCRAVIGSVSDYVSHNAPCPVAICRKFREIKKDQNNEEDEDSESLNVSLDEDDDELDNITRDEEKTIVMNEEAVMMENKEQYTLKNSPEKRRAVKKFGCFGTL